jgi:hypothetical protein
MNDLVVQFTLVAATWLFAGLCIAVSGRFKQLAAMVTGPAVAGVILAISQDWGDPAWFTIGAVVMIGLLVGTIVASAWLFLERRPTD